MKFNLLQLPPLTYFLTDPRAIAVYLRLLVWPAGQNVDRSPRRRSAKRAVSNCFAFSGTRLCLMA